MKDERKRSHWASWELKRWGQSVLRAGVVVVVGIVVGFFEVVEEVDVVVVVEFEPFGDGRGGAAAALGEGLEYFLFEVGVGDVADADHGGGV